MQIELDDETLDILHSVHSSINRRIRYVKDNEQYGLKDEWVSLPESWQGDCEDFALSKMMQLIEYGIDEDCLGIATCWCYPDDPQSYHAVLVVSTTRGDLILDNRYDHIMAWEACGYKWGYIPKNVQDGQNQATPEPT